jgi:diphosphomevalonate decarboxylase
MPPGTATALSHPNIAFIKYWGNRDHALRIPSTGSISMSLDGLLTRTRVSFDPDLTSDRLAINGQPQSGVTLERVSALLEHVRRTAGAKWFAEVRSDNNFPAGTGIASSASAFAALALAASRGVGLELDERGLSRLARLGSGSACRSIPGGFVEWLAGEDDLTSYAYSIAPPDHWALVDCIAICSQEHKTTASREGHLLADTSPYQSARVQDAPRRLDLCRRAILDRDFDALAEIMEIDSNLMHAVMMTGRPPLIYWQPSTLAIMFAVSSWRKAGLPVCYTIDAGPNVHVICPGEWASQVVQELRDIPGVEQVLVAPPGGPAVLEER